MPLQSYWYWYTGTSYMIIVIFNYKKNETKTFNGFCILHLFPWKVSPLWKLQVWQRIRCTRAGKVLHIGLAMFSVQFRPSSMMRCNDDYACERWQILEEYKGKLWNAVWKSPIILKILLKEQAEPYRPPLWGAQVPDTWFAWDITVTLTYESTSNWQALHINHKKSCKT